MQIVTGRYKNGQAPSAEIANAWVDQNYYLWGLVANERDVCTGAAGFVNAAFQTAQIYQGSFRYAGNTTLLCEIFAGATANMTITIPNDGTQKVINSNTGVNRTLTTLDISGGGAAYTVGKEYILSVSIDRGANPSCVATVYWVAAQLLNGINWPTLASFADGTVPTETDYLAATTAQASLLNVLQAPTGQGARITHINNIGNADTFGAGGFYYRGQNTLTVTYWVSNGAPASLIVQGNSIAETFSLQVVGHEVTDTFTLTPANYTLNTFYHFTVVCASTGTNYVDCISLGGTKALSAPPQKFQSLSAYNGSTAGGAPKLKPVCGNGATDNLAEIAVAARGTPTIGAALTGFQFLSPLVRAYDGFQTYGLGPTFRRPHILQYLCWLPASGGASGLVAVGGGATFGLTDTQGGGWNVTELDSQAGMAYGMFYVVSGVQACFEVNSP